MKPKPENVADYQLARKADGDVREIARYTIRTWGEQSHFRLHLLQDCIKLS